MPPAIRLGNPQPTDDEETGGDEADQLTHPSTNQGKTSARRDSRCRCCRRLLCHVAVLAAGLCVAFVALLQLPIMQGGMVLWWRQCLLCASNARYPLFTSWEELKELRGVPPFIAKSRTSPSFLVSTKDPYVEGYSHRSFHSSGMWEEEVYLSAKRALVDTGVCQSHKQQVHFIDFGSNIGFFTLFALAAGCRVLAVDGNPKLLEMLNFSVRLNGFDEARLRLHHLFLAQKAMGKINYKYYGNVRGVPTTSIDELLMEEGLLQRPSEPSRLNAAWQIPMLKMDIEWSVEGALKGAEHTFASHKVKMFQIEVWNSNASYAFLKERAVLDGYSGTFGDCCGRRSSVGDPCTFAARDVDRFSELWSIVFPKHKFCNMELKLIDSLIKP